MATNNKEFLDQWLIETDPARRGLMIDELTKRNLFPSDEEYDEYGLYPDLNDENFLMKLFHKREFAENKLENLEDLATCQGKVEFELLPVQRFVSNYLSAKTPYNSALLYHGVGVGKTCSAISIAEAYLYIYPKKKVFIVAPPNIQPNFIRTIFDIENVIISNEIDVPNIHNGCTGNLYLELTGTEYEKDLHVIEKKVRVLINTRYDLMGYLQLASHIERIVDRVSPSIKDPERRRHEEIIALRKEFSGACMIIDEAHNLRDMPGESEENLIDTAGGLDDLTDAAQGKRLTPRLIRVLKYAIDMKLVLLTATPMYNSYVEILFLLNLLLENDKQATLKSTDIFDSNGIKDDVHHLFGKIVQKYVSYMRGETPMSFPIRLNPTNSPTLKTWPSIAPDNSVIKVNDIIIERLLKLPIVPVRFSEETYNVYESIVDKAVETNKLSINSIDTIVQAGNWIYPNEDENLDDRMRDRGFDNCFSDSSRGRTQVGTSKILTQYKAIVDPKWLLAENLANYSPKSEFIIKRIRKSEGPIFVYSRYIKSGALPFALALEANGYTPYGRDRGLLMNGNQLESGLQCALCEHRKGEHLNSNHEFVAAKYVLFTGRKDISPNNAEAVRAERAYTNYNGSDIKVIIGSQVAREGIDLKYIREIYMFDSWFHLNRMEQVLGRGIRTCSHVHPNIPKEKRNCTIYLMVNTLLSRESADMYMYRLGMMKAIQIGKISRIIKRYALDCNLNIEGNLIVGLDKMTEINSQNNPPEGTLIDINDKNYSSMCDWMECEFTCAEPINIDLKTSSTLTYDEYSFSWREAQIKKVMKKLFESHSFIHIEDIQELMTAIPNEALFSILHDIVGNKSFRLHVNGNEGYLIYRNGYYLFQPLSLDQLDIPLALRIAHYPVKIDTYIPSKVSVPKMEIKDVQAEQVPKNDNVLIKFWHIFTNFAKQIETGTLDVNGIALPKSIESEIIDKYKGNKDLITYNIYRIEMILWFYTSIKSSIIDRKLYSIVVLQYIWDNFLTSQEQFTLFKTEDVEHIATEQIVNDKYFRFINLQKEPYKINYVCEDKLCAQSVIDQLEKNDILNTLKANVDTSGKGYGFIVPIKSVLTFKSNNIVAQVGKDPEAGQGCKIISNLKPHIESLVYLGSLLKEKLNSDLDLNKENFDSSSRRYFKNVQRYCALRELVLRFMDSKQINGLHWFYRPIAAYKTNHGKK